MNLATIVVIVMAAAIIFCMFLIYALAKANRQDKAALKTYEDAVTFTQGAKGSIVVDEQACRAAFEHHFKEGGYQYSDDNKQNAYGWFRTGWILMQAHPLLPDSNAPTGSPEWDLAMTLHAPRLK